jgi:hypothetical protein
MKTQQIVQSQANVIRVTNISAGDVYKRFENEGYDKGTYYGIVKNVYNDGEKTIIESTECKYEYSRITPKYKTISGTDDVVLFPASVEEMNLEFENARSSLERKITESLREVEEAKQQIIALDGLITGETQKKLKAMSFIELSQSEFDEKRKALGA